LIQGNFGHWLWEQLVDNWGRTAINLWDRSGKAHYALAKIRLEKMLRGIGGL
jgi:hypothetical protein